MELIFADRVPLAQRYLPSFRELGRIQTVFAAVEQRK
jgi:hypothetical protein